MPERTIVGVDFSGAQGDKNTWIAEGKLDGDSLDILSSHPVRRDDLTEYLKCLGPDTVAALDFPFGVPIAFAKRIAPSKKLMPDLWNAVAGMRLEEFTDHRNRHVGEDRRNEHLRAGDLLIPGCYSCLHDVNPNMVPMTFCGMKMLQQLWESGCNAPPLPAADRKGPVLLESMPGAVLWSLKLPQRNSGKAYKNKSESAPKRRKEILDGLESRSKIKLPVLQTEDGEIYRKCLENHDCLDSVVAAVAAAMWANKSAFRRPSGARTVRESLQEFEVSPNRRSPGLAGHRDDDGTGRGATGRLDLYTEKRMARILNRAAPGP